jgi:CubicO group peptidase (beta-lactamase class C family)
LASVTKQFTAAGILRLVEQGQIELDQPVGDHLQDFPFAGVTVRHLLNQTSGIPDVYMSLAKQHRKEFGDSLRITDVVDLIRRHPPRAKLPGDEYRYSNTNYVLLAGVIESVSGMSYEDFMREELFEPLGMKHTRVWNRVSAIQEFPERAEDFEAIGSIRVPLPLTWIDSVAGDGAVFCSLQDFLIWDEFWNGNPLVSDRVLGEAFVRPKLNDGSLSDYGFGWLMRGRSGRLVMHNGRWLGAGTYIMRDAGSGLCLVVLDNSQNHRLGRIAVRLQSEVLAFPQSKREQR